MNSAHARRKCSKFCFIFRLSCVSVSFPLMMVHLLRHYSYSYSAIVNFVSAIFTRMAFGVWISIGTLACWQNAAHNGTGRLATTTACWIALNGHDCVLFSLFSRSSICFVATSNNSVSHWSERWGCGTYGHKTCLWPNVFLFVTRVRRCVIFLFFASSISSTQFALLRLFLRWWLLRGYTEPYSNTFLPFLFVWLFSGESSAAATAYRGLSFRARIHFLCHFFRRIFSLQIENMYFILNRAHFKHTTNYQIVFACY